nr:MAG TPA: dCTP deaminase dUTPase [Caudoviricetes sp.]
MKNLLVKIVDERVKPEMINYQTEGSAAIDLYCFKSENEDEKFTTGIAVKIPDGYVGLIMPRSSTGRKDISLKNTVGVIDSDYTGEITYELFNRNGHMDEKVKIINGQRCFQLLIMPVEHCNIEFVDELPVTARGSNGWGSTGSK